MNQPRAFDTIVYGGLTAAAFDIVNASTFWYVTHAVPPMRILQGIAAGLLGPKVAFAGGAATAALGGALHIFIACCMAAVYWLACARVPALWQRPWIYGPAYGVACYLVMENVVLPLSATRPAQFTPGWFLADVVGHALLVGLPIALLARRSALKIGTPTSITT